MAAEVEEAVALADVIPLHRRPVSRPGKGRQPLWACAAAALATVVTLLVVGRVTAPVDRALPAAATAPSASTETVTPTPPAVVPSTAPPPAVAGGTPAAPTLPPPPGSASVSVRVRVAPGQPGRVLSDDGRIDCPGTCTAAYWPGSTVVLHASGSRFLGWDSCLQPNGRTCTVTTTGPITVVADYGSWCSETSAITNGRLTPTWRTTDPKICHQGP